MRMLCRMLVVSMFMLSFNGAWAGMVGTDQALAASSAQAERNVVLSALGRAEVASQLSAMGVDMQDAHARVAAMSDQEVRTLAGQIEALPAGAASGWEWVLVAAIIAGAIYYFYVMR